MTEEQPQPTDQSETTGSTSVAHELQSNSSKREQRKQRQEERQTHQVKQNKQNKQKKFGAKIGIAALAIVVIALIWNNAGSDTSSPQTLALTGQDHVKGSGTAIVTLVEYSDFQCPACGLYFPIVKQLSEELTDEVRIVYRHFPLSQIHPNARAAAYAVEAAGRQDAFWQMHDILFGQQSVWSDERNPEDLFVSYAEQLGLNIDQFKSDMSSESVKDKVKADERSGNTLNVNSTPTFFLNGKKINNPRSLEDFRSLIQSELGKNN